MKAPAIKSGIARRRAALALALTITISLCVCLIHGTPAGAQAEGPGRILSSTGVAFGGIIEFNSNASNLVHLSSNTFDGACTGENANKSYHPSTSRDGSLIAFSSDRNRTGAVGGSSAAYRIFVMNADGTNVRQLTTSADATIPGGTTAGDINPVISPDGSRVAFMSERNRPAGDGVSSIFIVNTDGSGGIRQVTFPQADNNPACNGCGGGTIYSLVWSPDGARLAFKGFRLAADASTTSPNLHTVVGFINADGTGETTLARIDSTGVHEGIDWSPDGRYIAIPFGREAQGAPSFRVILFDLQAGTSREILPEGNIPGGNFNTGSGHFRFSPDSQRLVYTTSSDPVRLVVVDLNGVQQSLESIPLSSSGQALWWQAGAAIPTPARLELVPDPVITVNGGPATQVIPTLFDAQGNVIVRAATGWTVGVCMGGTPTVSHMGLATPGTTTSNYRDTLCANNGGLTTCAALFVNPTDISLTLTASPNPVVVGNNVTFNMTVTNNGPARAEGVTINIQSIGQNFTVLSNSPECGNGFFTCSLSAMAANETRTLTIVARADTTGTFTASTTASTGFDPNPANNAPTVSVTVAEFPIPPANCLAPPANLSVWYKGEDNTNDSQGSNHATPQNGVTFAEGVVGRAFSFDGTDDQVLTPTLNLGNQFSVEMWVRPTRNAGFEHLVSNDFRSQNYGALYFNGNIQYWQGGTRRISSPVVALNRWAHVALVYDGSVARLYLNGQPAGESDPHTATFNNVVALGFATQNESNHFAGRLDEVSLYNRALSVEDVASIYNASSKGKCNTSTGSDVTVQSGDAAVTFTQVTAAGETAITPLDPAAAGALAPGYALSSGSIAFDITTTAGYAPPVTACFKVSSVNDPAEFARLRVLHGEGGRYVDRTILAPDSPAPDFATRTLCARVSTLSPFVIALAPQPSGANGAVLISEFRLRGPAPEGARDEFVELYNASDAPADISGYALAFSDGTAVTVPADTLLPARGHYLIANADGYSLGASAAPDQTYAERDVPDDASLALFNAVNQMSDAAGFAGNTSPYREGGGLPVAAAGVQAEHSYVRKQATGAPQDTGDNAADFIFVSMDGGTYGGVQSLLGAPGPENAASPILHNGTIKASLVDPACAGFGAAASACARHRDGTQDDANNSRFGTLSIRRKFTNQTGRPVSRLRFRIVDVTAGSAPSGTADLRARSSITYVATCTDLCPDTNEATTTIIGLALEAPSGASNGGLNSTLAHGEINLDNQLQPLQSTNVHFLPGVQQNGGFRFFVNVEAVTGAQAAGEGVKSGGYSRSKKTATRRVAHPTN